MKRSLQSYLKIALIAILTVIISVIAVACGGNTDSGSDTAKGTESVKNSEITENSEGNTGSENESTESAESAGSTDSAESGKPAAKYKITFVCEGVTLSEIEQSVSEKLGETDELTLERSEQFAALQQNVRTVRAMLNQGNYDFSVAQINELSPKFAEWMRQISQKSIQQSSENTLTKEEIMHDFEQIETQNRAEIWQEQHEEFEITML